MLDKLSIGIWTIAFDLETARGHYAAAGKLWRQAAACVALAIVRLAGLRI